LANIISLKQAGGGTIRITHIVNGVQIDGITEAKYQIFDKLGVPFLTKTLNNGITFEDGKIVIVLSEADTEYGCGGAFRHECGARDLLGRMLFVLDGQISLNATKVRLPA
jgi:hypothetical protein